MSSSIVFSCTRVFCGFAALALAACSSSVVQPGPTPPMGMGSPDGGQQMGAPLNGCTTYDDRTADTADRTILWVRSVGTVCLKIKKGQSVTWNPKDTDFASHPLKPSGGTSPSPIISQGPGTAPYAQAFSTTGTFGFICGFHFDMTGAIQVVE